MLTKGRTQTIEGAVSQFLTKKKGKLKQSTYSRYSFICERHIIPYFEKINLNKVNEKIINEFIQYKRHRGGLTNKTLSPKTINDITCLLLQIIKDHRKIDLDIGNLSYKQSEISIFTDKEYNRLKKYLSIETDSKKLGIIIAMLTGIRIGELCALKWENIDLKNGVINIDKTIQRIKITDSAEKRKTKIVIDTPKSNASIRAIPIPAVLLHKLETFKASANTYILTNTTDYIEPRIYQRHFKSYLTASNIKDNNFHALRHTFATMAISREVDIKTVSILLGHTDVGFTMKRYVHPNIEHRRVQIEKLAVGF